MQKGVPITVALWERNNRKQKNPVSSLA